MPNVKLPTSDSEYAEWLARLADLAAQRATDLPLTTLQIANLEAMSRLFATVLADSERSKAQWRQDVQDKNYLRKEADAHCQRYVRLILDDSSVPDSIKMELGLTKPEAKKSKPTRRMPSRLQTTQAYA